MTLSPPAIIDAFTEPRPAEPERGQDQPAPIAVVYPSRSGGTGHVVGIIGGTRTLTCTCPAGLATFNRPRGCWAMVATRRLLGYEPVS